MQKIKLGTWFLALFTSVCFTMPVSGQGSQAAINTKPPPDKQSFKARGDLASPWRDSGCHRTAVLFREIGCRLVQGDEWKNANVLTLYNSDGTVWYQFELSWKRSAKYYAIQKEGFKPFSVPYTVGSVVLLRIVAESDDWLEVEVNEDTRKTKFVSKHDPMWSTTKYEYWLAESGRITLGQSQLLREIPNGEPIPSYQDDRPDEVLVKKIEGEWAFVEKVDSTPGQGTHGWIRWKKDRDILVGCLLNQRKLPEDLKKNH